MKAIVDRVALHDLLRRAQFCTVSKTPNELYKCVRVEASSGLLTVQATCGDRQVSMHTESVDTVEPGSAIVPIEHLSRFLNVARSPTHEISVADTSLKLTGTHESQTIYGHGEDAWANVHFTQPDDVAWVGTWPATDVLGKIASATPFVARENSRYAIAGALLQIEETNLIVVATDGRRLACMGGKSDRRGNGTHAVVMPTQTMRGIVSLPEEDDEVTIGIDGDHSVWFKFGEWCIVRSAINIGTFPPYEDVIPKGNQIKATVDVAELTESIRVASLMVDEQSNAVRFNFNGSLSLTSRTADRGESFASCEIEKYEGGDPIEIGLNPKYLIDILASTSAKTLTLEMQAPNKPVVIQDGPRALYVLMPINIG